MNTLLSRLRWFGLAALLVQAAALGESAPAERTLHLEANSQQLLSQARPPVRVAIGDPKVADVELLSSGSILLYGKAVGATELRLWPRGGGPVQTYRVVVDASTGAAREAVAATGQSGLSVRSVGPMVKLEGSSDSLPAQQAARQAVQASTAKGQMVDDSRLSFDTQVQTDIKVVEVSRQALMESGVNLGKNTGNTTLAITTPGSLSGVQSNSSGGYTLESKSGFLPIAQAFNLVAGNASKGLLGVMSLLESNGFAYTLAEPSLTVMSGQNASFLAGGEVPIPVSQGATGNISIQYRDYGIRLLLTPTVLDRDRIVLKVAPEVSELDPTTGVQTGGVSVPGFRVRRTETTVQLADGESFVISGLISRNNVSAIDKIPFLGDIPILGAFFKSTRFERNDKELIMVVTPHLVRALGRGTATPPLPGQREGNYRPSFGQLLFFETGSRPSSEGGFSD